MELEEEIVELARGLDSRLRSMVDSRVIDTAWKDIGAYEVVAVVGRQHGTGFHVILEGCVAGLEPVLGSGVGVADAIRDAVAKTR